MSGERRSAKPKSSTAVFTREERAAMKEHAQERRKASRRGADAAGDAEGDVLAKIAEMTPADRRLAERLHALVKTNAPTLTPRLWYGMPAYADDAGKVVCFFQSGQKFRTRYATLGFSDRAALDEGSVWPTAFALVAMTSAAEATIVALLQRAVR